LRNFLEYIGIAIYQYISATKVEEVNISDNEANRITILVLERKFKIEKTDFIKDGKLLREVEYRTSHSWSDTEVVREATELDHAVLSVLKSL
jgi:hypothetical protein